MPPDSAVLWWSLTLVGGWDVVGATVVCWCNKQEVRWESRFLTLNQTARVV